MYFRVKRTGSYAYLQIVESFREQGQVHQRVLSTVGRASEHVKNALRLGHQEGKIEWWWPMLTLLAREDSSGTRL